MATRLGNFLQRYTDRPFAWGADDCSLFLADWWQEIHGVDPAAHLRGTYSDEAGKAAIVMAAGGIVNLVAGIAARAGASVRMRHSEIIPEDFAVIAPGVGAIWDGQFWVGRSVIGLTFTSDATIWRAWSP